MTAPTPPAEPWDGVPINPMRHGFHWLGTEIWFWRSHGPTPWMDHLGNSLTCMTASKLSYGGPIPTPAELDAYRRVADAARAYRAEEQSDTPRMWRGKKLQDLADLLDAALDALDATPDQPTREEE